MQFLAQTVEWGQRFCISNKLPRMWLMMALLCIAGHGTTKGRKELRVKVYSFFFFPVQEKYFGKNILDDGDAAAASKSLQSCPTLCDPIDGSPPGSTVPGILQARTLEWVAISFSNA